MSEERNIFQKIGDAVTDYAPGIAGILALVPGVGTVPSAALGAVSALGKALGLGTQAKPEEVLSAISVDPEIRLKAMVAENDFKLAVMKEENAKLKTLVDDVQSARSLKSDEVKSTGKRDYEDKLFDWFITVGFVITLLWLINYKPAESTYLGMMIGTIITAFTSVVNFRKGTTANSSAKNEMLFNSTPVKR